MPKQSLLLNQYHGGINSRSDSRDIGKEQLVDLVNGSVDEIGRIVTSGSKSLKTTIFPSDNTGINAITRTSTGTDYVDATYSNVKPESTSSLGLEAVFEITVASNTVAASGAIEATVNGYGYAVDDTVTIAGEDLSGGASTTNLVLTVASITTGEPIVDPLMGEINDGYGLFRIGSDFNHNGTANSKEDYIIAYNDSNGNIYWRPASQRGWFLLFDTGWTASQNAKPFFFSVDGAIRVSSTNFSNTTFDSLWIGALNKTLFPGGNPQSRSGWYKEVQELLKPIGGTLSSSSAVNGSTISNNTVWWKVSDARALTTQILASNSTQYNLWNEEAADGDFESAVVAIGGTGYGYADISGSCEFQFKLVNAEVDYNADRKFLIGETSSGTPTDVVNEFLIQGTYSAASPTIVVTDADGSIMPQLHVGMVLTSKNASGGDGDLAEYGGFVPGHTIITAVDISTRTITVDTNTVDNDESGDANNILVHDVLKSGKSLYVAVRLAGAGADIAKQAYEGGYTKGGDWTIVFGTPQLRVMFRTEGSDIDVYTAQWYMDLTSMLEQPLGEWVIMEFPWDDAAFTGITQSDVYFRPNTIEHICNFDFVMLNTAESGEYDYTFKLMRFSDFRIGDSGLVGNTTSGYREYAYSLRYGDAGNESLLFPFPSGLSTIGANANTYNLSYTAFTDGFTNNRITGANLYSVVERMPFRVAELDFEKGLKGAWEFTFPTSDAFNAVPDSGTKNYSNTVTTTGEPSIESFEAINGYKQTVTTTSARYKAATILNRKAYVGNIYQDGKQKGDKMIKSMTNSFDCFPEEGREIDVAINDGDDIIKLEAYADRILQFKRNVMYLINATRTAEYLEDTFMGKGVEHPGAACRTDFGVAWVNENGCYLYDGKQVNNLIEAKIKESTWNTFVNTNSQIFYLPLNRKIVVCGGTNENDTYEFSLITQSWARSTSKLTNPKTNFVTDIDSNVYYMDTDGLYSWDDAESASTSFSMLTREEDFGNPSQRKKIYKIFVTYTGGVSGPQPEKWSVRCVDDVSNSLDQKYFKLIGATGPVKVWIDTNESGTAPGSGGYAKTIEVVTKTDSDSYRIAGDVASAINLGQGGDNLFTTRVDGNVVTVIDSANAVRADIPADIDTGFTITKIQDGTNSTIAQDIDVTYATDGGSSFSQFDANLTDSTGNQVQVELKPTSSINNIKTLQLKFSGTAASTFQINDIAITYRLKSVK